jgi:hypothetical protein
MGLDTNGIVDEVGIVDQPVKQVKAGEGGKELNTENAENTENTENTANIENTPTTSGQAPHTEGGLQMLADFVAFVEAAL